MLATLYSMSLHFSQVLLLAGLVVFLVNLSSSCTRCSRFCVLLLRPLARNVIHDLQSTFIQSSVSRSLLFPQDFIPNISLYYLSLVGPHPKNMLLDHQPHRVSHCPILSTTVYPSFEEGSRPIRRVVVSSPLSRGSLAGTEPPEVGRYPTGEVGMPWIVTAAEVESPCCASSVELVD